MATYAVFNDEGCIEQDFASKEAAEEAAAGYRARYEREEGDGGDNSAYAAEECPEHPEEPADTCEECLLEEDRYGEDDDSDDEDGEE